MRESSSAISPAAGGGQPVAEGGGKVRPLPEQTPFFIIFPQLLFSGLQFFDKRRGILHGRVFRFRRGSFRGQHRAAGLFRADRCHLLSV